MPSEINALVADARRSFRAAGIPPDEAAIDARLLAQHVLGWDAARLLTHGDAIATSEFASAFDALVARRTGREPLAYITGAREFWNLTFVVTPAVLIPRPETELLIETALDLLERDQPLRLIDLCTGSGCVAVALAREFAHASMTASDISADALDVARRNVARHGLATRVPCIQADLLSGITSTFDAIIANPPYVPAVDAATLQPEVRRFEPPTALFGGGDGLHIIRRLVHDSVQSLAPGGLLLFEIGADQDETVSALVTATRGLTLLDIRRDLQDIPRAVVVQKI